MIVSPSVWSQWLLYSLNKVILKPKHLKLECFYFIRPKGSLQPLENIHQSPEWHFSTPGGHQNHLGRHTYLRPWWSNRTKATKQLFPDTGHKKCGAMRGNQRVEPYNCPHLEAVSRLCIGKGTLERPWGLTEWTGQGWGFREAEVARICAAKYQGIARKESF